MKRASIAVAVLVALTLTGCAGTPEAAPSKPREASETATVETPEPTVAPLTAAPVPEGVDAAFLAEIRKRTDVATIAQATDDQLIAAGHAACDAFAADPNIESLRLIEGEVPQEDGRYFDSIVIGTHAAMYMCTEYKSW